MVNDMLKRVVVGAILILFFISVLLLGGWYQCAALSLAALMSAYELCRALRQSERKVFAAPAYVLAASYCAVYRLLGPRALLLLWLACALFVCGERVFNPRRATQDTLLGLSLLMYPAALYVALMLVAEQGGFAASRLGLIAAFAMPLAGDTFAYFIGISLGRRKLCPELSPNKTVAGGVGGLVGGMAGGLLAFFLQGFFPAGAPLLELLALGLACGAIGQVGDLFASAIKRYAGVKDYGYIFPGHGGVMDRLDSVLFCAPIVYAVFTLRPH